MPRIAVFAPLALRSAIHAPLALRVAVFAPLALLALLLPVGGLRSVAADVVTTTAGLTLEGEVTRHADGSVEVKTPAGSVVLPAREVAQVKPGDGPRTTWNRERDAAAPKDAAAWYRLALRADELGLADAAREAHAQVVALEPEHAASHRALGHEKVEGAWLSGDEARRRKGFVLYAGAWRLAEELETLQRNAGGPAILKPGTDDARWRRLLVSAAGTEAALAAAAHQALATAPKGELVAAALGLLCENDPALRALCCRTLGELGDESALRALLFHGARDLDTGVRREAVLAAASFGHDDTAVPFVRALGSENPRLVAYAAQALGVLGDTRAAGYIVKRLVSHGSSTRNFVSFLNQISYVRDYDVEIAQASNIANPNIGTISEGAVLDVKVNDAAYTETWIEPYLVDALSQLSGRRIADAAAARAWIETLPERERDFPKQPSARAPRRAPGRLVGVPPIR